MRSTIGGYLSLVNSQSPKQPANAAQSFSFDIEENECSGGEEEEEDENENRTSSSGSRNKLKSGWKYSHSALIKTIPKCFRPNQPGGGGVCQSIRKSLVALPHKSSFKSKSDNCLHKINSNSSGEGATSSKKTFGQKVANALAASFHLSKASSNNNQSSSSSASENQYTTTQSDSVLIKSTSLERNVSLAISEAEQAKRTRSLERNHRHLVTIDSSCRYSREVGSTQIALPDLSSAPAASADLSGRYHPDPTWRPTFNRRRPLTSSSSSASTSSSASSTQSNPEPSSSHHYNHHRRNRRGRKMATTSTPKAKANLPLNSSSASASIVTKPARGWLHPDYLFAKDGINYNVRYMGCLEVNTSMKVLDFDTRSAIAKECINRLCEAKSASTLRKADSRIGKMLSDNPCLDKAGANVQLTITSLWLKLSDLDSGNAIFVHEMPNISFASGGDADKLDFVAYVAKDRHNVRSCYVLECGGGLAQDVITTIGQAFELRFKEFLKRAPVTKPPPLQVVPAPRTSLQEPHRVPDDVEYYNDLPGKTPPDFSPVQKTMSRLERTPTRDSASSNLIDFHTDITSSSTLPHPPHGHHFPGSEPEYVNGGVPNPQLRKQSGHRDPFDMSPFATSAPGLPDVSAMKLQLLKEEWFHGPISREDAESLLQNDGDFLVRESKGSSGQYVLTGMQSNSKKHLLLVDPEGIVRTKDRTFESVSHLINYHRDNGRPIISAESALRLIAPVKPVRRMI